MKKVLFVNDDPLVQRSMAQLLTPLSDTFNASYARNAEEALSSLASSPCDIIVADMGLPEVNGGELLSQVRKSHPRMVRVLLSDPSNRELSTRFAPEAHQCLPRSATQEALKLSLVRSAALHDMLTSGRLLHLVSNMKTLPSMPALYLELVEAMKDPNVTIEDLGQIIAKDIGMTAKVLQIVNSSLLGLRERISSPGQAATFLGLDTLRSLVLSLGVFSQFDERQMVEFSIAETLEHSMRVAAFTRAILQAEKGDKRMLEEGFLAGMMHDCGKLVLATNRAQRFRAARLLSKRDGLDLTDMERRLFGASHAGLGAYLLGEWGLPSDVVEAVCFHHTPGLSHERSFSLLTAVHAANCFARLDLEGEIGDVPELDWDYLLELGYARSVPHWIEACRQVLEAQAAHADPR